MARKVFISFLGASNYQECDYKRDSISYGKVRYIQEATLNYLNVKKEWTKSDAIYILLTKDSEKKNWVDNGQHDHKTNEPIIQEGLCSRLNKMFLNTPVLPVSELPDGHNEHEIWTIFERLFELIQENDELYFDLTHGYRYLPMLMLVLGNYSKFLKHVTIKSITYGNYEISNRGQEPGLIVDFLPLSQLQDWTTAAANYLNLGNADQLVELSNQSLKPILSEAKGSNANATKIKQFVSSLRDMINERQMCRGLSIFNSKSLKKAKDAAMEISGSLISPLTPILEEIKKSLSKFSDTEDINNGIIATQWCIEKYLYQQAITILDETIISIMVSSLGLDYKEKRNRDIVSVGFRVKGLPQEDWNINIPTNLTEEEYRAESSRQRHFIAKFIKKPDYDKWAKTYNSLANLRNDINHCGMRDNPISSNRIKQNINMFFSEVQSFLNNNPFGPYQKQKSLNSVLINLSNHPLSKWSKEQRAAAQEYGEIMDLPFPPVKPEAEVTDIKAIVDEYTQKVIDLAHGKSATVHIMGEMTLTFALVNKLQSIGIKCIASTTARIAEEDEDHTKHVKFDFCKFREYEW